MILESWFRVEILLLKVFFGDQHYISAYGCGWFSWNGTGTKGATSPYRNGPAFFLAQRKPSEKLRKVCGLGPRFNRISLDAAQSVVETGEKGKGSDIVCLFGACLYTLLPLSCLVNKKQGSHQTFENCHTKARKSSPAACREATTQEKQQNYNGEKWKEKGEKTTKQDHASAWKVKKVCQVKAGSKEQQTRQKGTQRK